MEKLMCGCEQKVHDAHWAKVKQLTRNQAIAIAEGGEWKKMTQETLALAQLHQARVFCNFGDFQEAVEKLLGRPVWTHEFVCPSGLMAEYKGEKPTPTMDEILDLIPAEKRIVVQIAGGHHGEEEEEAEEA